MNKLEQILELLLAEETEKAEELLHEYVVDKARSEYERVLDESEEEVDETIDQTNDFEDDILNDEEEIEDAEIFGEDEEEEGEEEMDMDMDMDMDMEDSEEEGEEEGEDDLEDKVEDLEAELEDLRAEFEKLMADEMEEPHHGDDMDMEDGEEEMMDSVEYDLDEAEEVDEEEELEEATQFSQQTAEQPMKSAHTLKGGEADSNESPYTKAPKPTAIKNGNTGPVKAKDGSEGKKNHGGSVKDHTPTDNIDVEPKKA